MLPNTLKRWTVVGVALASWGFAGMAAAQGYVGASAGMTTVDICDDFGPGLSSCDDEDTGMKIFGGYNFSQNFGIEGSWVDLGEISATGPGGTASAETDGFAVAAVGMIPLNDQFGIFGKVGAFMWDVSGGGAATGVDDDGTDIMFGAGVRWNFTAHFGLRAEWERFDVDGDDVDFLSVGAQFTF